MCSDQFIIADYLFISFFHLLTLFGNNITKIEPSFPSGIVKLQVMINNPHLNNDNTLSIPKKLLEEVYSTVLIQSARTGYGKSNEEIARYLKDYFKETLENKNSELFEKCSIAKIGTSDATLRRAFSGKINKETDAPVKYQLLDFYCYIAFEKTLAECVLDNKYLDEETAYSVELPLYAQRQIYQLLHTKTTETVKSELYDLVSASNAEKPVIFKSKYIVRLSKVYWDSLKIMDKNESLKSISRYYTHTDSTIIPKAVAQDGGIVEPIEIYDTYDRDGNYERKSISQILEDASSQTFSLIKILAEGGVGKSTFLYWVSKKYCDQYIFLLLKRVNEAVIEDLIEICKYYPNPNRQSFVLLIDNVAVDETANSILDLISELRNAQSSSFIFIVAERESRYNPSYEHNSLDKVFGEYVQTVKYESADIAEIFEHVYSELERTNLDLKKSKLKDVYKHEFIANSISSTSERIFLLLESLKLKNVIDYSFDWDDWDDLIESKSQFSDLKGLFTVVACFYQFGIKPKITLQSTFLRKTDRVLILEALSEFTTDKNPIMLDESGNALVLKHEHIARWYLKTKKGKVLAKGFVQCFIEEINNIVSAKLFRKLRKVFGLEEYKNSCFAEYLTPNVALRIITNYLTLPNISTLEKEKMLNEKGMILLLLDREEEAIEVFKELSILFPLNNHSRDKLAKIYSKSPKTFQNALELYNEIYKNGGVYAKVEIYKVLKRAQELGISLVYNEDPEIVRRLLLKQIREFISNEQYEAALSILKDVELDPLVIKCYRDIAQYLPFTKENIETKKGLFRQAIKYNKEIAPQNINYSLIVDYAVFLFRIEEFRLANLIIKKYSEIASDQDRVTLKKEYRNKVQGSMKLFWADMPDKENHIAMRKYLQYKIRKAVPLIDRKHMEDEADVIFMGYLILRTVQFHSYHYKIEFYNATRLLAYCFMNNAGKGWNNFSTKENMIIAENLYDQLIKNGVLLPRIALSDMIKNLLNFKESIKYKKALRIIDYILKNRENRKYSGFYRYRGTVKKSFEDFQGAMQDYQVSLKKCIRKNYAGNKEKDYINDMCYTYYNIASLICECIENMRPLKGYDLETAKLCCYEIEKLSPRPIFGLKELKERIQRLS